MSTSDSLRCTGLAIAALATAIAAACSETPVEAVSPGDPLLDVTTLAAPVEGEFEVVVNARTVATLPNCPFPGEQDEDGNWHIPPVTTGCIIITVTEDGVVPVTKGTITFYSCIQERSLGLPAVECETKGGNGRWTRFHTSFSVDENGEVKFLNGSAFPTGIGWYWAYKAQGSGIQNHTSEPFDIISDLVE